jgi:hypothetical protein
VALRLVLASRLRAKVQVVVSLQLEQESGRASQPGVGQQLQQPLAAMDSLLSAAHQVPVLEVSLVSVFS